MTDREYTLGQLETEIRQGYGRGYMDAGNRHHMDTAYRLLEGMALGAQFGTYGYAVARWYFRATDKQVKRLVRQAIKNVG